MARGDVSRYVDFSLKWGRNRKKIDILTIEFRTLGGGGSSSGSGGGNSGSEGCGGGGPKGHHALCRSSKDGCIGPRSSS